MQEKKIDRKKLFRLFFGFCLSQFIGCASVSDVSEINISDHFDGEEFYNPTLTEQFSPGFSDVFKMIWEGRPDWPDEVENIGVPRLGEKLDSNEISITFVNHTTFLIQFPGFNILTDPVWSERVSPFSWIGPKRVRSPGIKFEDLPHIDVIVISHNHYDHLDEDTLEKLNERFLPKVLVSAGDKSLIESFGIKNVQQLDWWDSVKISDDLVITFTPTQHSSGRGLFDRNESLWGSYLIKYGNQSVYFGGDAGYSTHYVEINKRLGSPDIALLGIGTYLPSWFMKPVHMNPHEGVIAHKDLGAKLSIGMHIGTFQQSSVLFDQHREDLIEALEIEKVSRESFILLPEGETIIYPREIHCQNNTPIEEEIIDNQNSNFNHND